MISGLETLGLVGKEKTGRGFAMMTPSKKGKGVDEEKRIVRGGEGLLGRCRRWDIEKSVRL